jgi:L-ascorbate metabolism protein UlaG (beta-lactamase superfamily)
LEISRKGRHARFRKLKFFPWRALRGKIPRHGKQKFVRIFKMENEITLAPASTPADVASGSIYFIGNATVLIRYGGFTILTDPTFIHMHEQVSIGYGMHSTRLTNPAMEIEDLPPLDLLVLSHFHGDHFDQVAEQKLDKSVPIVTTPEAAKALNERGFPNTYSLKTWARQQIRKGDVSLRVTAMPGRHGPPVVDLALPEVMGSMLQFSSPRSDSFKIYITGDTLVIDDLKEIPQRYPQTDIALLHLGGTRVLGIIVTMDAEQGVELMQIVQPNLAIPIHYNDYDVFKSPLEDFKREVQAAGLEQRVRYLSHGDTYGFSVRTRETAMHAGA